MRMCRISFAAASALALALAGCSSGSSGGSSSSAAASSTAPTSAGAAAATSAKDFKGVTLTMWVAQSTATTAAQPIAAWEKATGGKIKTVVIPDPYEGNTPTQLAAGAKPDMNWYQPSVSALPVIQPEKNLLPLDGEPWIKLLAPANQGFGVVKGVRYSALVKQPSVLGVYYNKAAFAKAGITAMPKNYDDFIALAKTLQAKLPGVAPMYEAGADKWPLQWQTEVQLSGVLGPDFWADLNANKASWTDPRFVNAVSKYDTEVIKGGLTNSDYKTGTFVEQGANLISGKAAMVVQVDALVPLLTAKLSTQQLNEQIGWFPLSAKGTNAQFAADATNAISLFKTGNTKNEEASKAFITFWLGEDYPAYIAANKFPSIESAVPSPAGLPDIVTAAAKAFPTATQMYYGYVFFAPDIHIYLNQMIFGQKTPETLAAAMESQFKQQGKAQGVGGF